MRATARDIVTRIGVAAWVGNDARRRWRGATVHQAWCDGVALVVRGVILVILSWATCVIITRRCARCRIRERRR